MENQHSGFNTEVVKRSEEFARESLMGTSHSFDHVKRVFNLAYVIGRKEGADLDVLLNAALLHDVSRDLEDHIGVNHAESGAYIAKEFLKKEGLPVEKARKVFDAILKHRFSVGDDPQTLEAQILSDADKLDAMGAIGITRVFNYSGQHDRNLFETLKHFDEKLLKLKDRMYTETARVIAEERHNYMVAYLQRLEKEIKGEM